MLHPKFSENPIAKVQAAIDSEVFLRLSVMDVQCYDNTLVVMTSHDVPRPFVKLLLKKIWNGPIEVYCGAALMSGFNTSLT